MMRENALRLLHAERAALVCALTDLPAERWEEPSLCTGWSVHDVLAHLTAAARTATLPWLVNMLASRFDTDRHNQRLLERHREADPALTLESLRAAAASSRAPFGEVTGILGEVVVHSQDIARPLGLPLVPAQEAVEAVAVFLAGKDFAVNSATLVRGLRLEATDGELHTGDGPLVRGPLLALVMAMAGRPHALDDLEGEGVEELRARVARG